MAKLILRKEGDDAEFPLDAGSLTIGRSPECDITIEDSQASRRHCSVVKVQSGFEVADLGSTNGTLVNSTLVKKKRLVHGDVIRIGAIEIAFSVPDSAGATGEMTSCFLVHAKGARKGERVELTQQRTTIGRKQTNTIVVEDNVCSSYHCEIVRDLNGYTIRDLGSTNGTLVNGEMITESQLGHGARIRVGNLRFVFQDPSMAEVDLEAGAEEDDEWGMMRELDLAAVRKRNPATIFYGVLFLAILGGLYFLTQIKTDKGGTVIRGPEGNLVDDFSFEGQGSQFAWLSEPAGAVTVGLTTATKKSGAQALELKSNVDSAEVFQGSQRPAGGGAFELRAHGAARGEVKARLGLLWTGLGLERWDDVAVPSGGLQELRTESSAPPWASRMRLGLRAEGSGTVVLDDVSLVRVGGARETRVEQESFLFTVVDARGVDLSHAGAPILAHGRPVARDASGNPVEGALKVTIEAADDKHVVCRIEGADAASVGLEFEEVAGYLSRGGFRAFTPQAEETFHASFPDEDSLALDGVRKPLLGPAARAIAVLPRTDDGRLMTEARVDGRRRLWTVLGAPEAGARVFRFKTNLRDEATEASRRMTNALNLHQSARYGEFLEDANAVLAEFPFANPALRRDLSTKIQEVNQEYADLRRRLDTEVREYKEFKDLQNLDNARSILGQLRDRFQVEAGKGARGEHLAQATEEVDGLYTAALRKKQGQQAQALMDQALYLHVPAGETYVAALLLSYVAWHLPDSPQAAKAAQELEKIRKEHPEVLAVLTKLGLDRRSADG